MPPIELWTRPTFVTVAAITIAPDTSPRCQAPPSLTPRWDGHEQGRMISPSTLFTRLPEQATKRHFSAEEKIRIVLESLRGEDSIAEFCCVIAEKCFASMRTPPINGPRSS